MAEKSVSQEFKLKKQVRQINSHAEETDQNEFVSEKYKKIGITLNYIEHLLILTSAVTGCVSVSALASQIGINHR